MSFILDALRKSESERQREAAPNYSRVPLAPARNRIPAWTWALIGTLLVALIAIAAAWWRSGAIGLGNSGSEPPAMEPATFAPEPQPPAGSRLPESGPVAETPARVRSINELAGLAPDLPDYRLELLAYNATDPAAGYARINGRRYVTGDRIGGGGPEVIELRVDGVVLGYAGERFLLTAR
jgi:general secretion pathway protein B